MLILLRLFLATLPSILRPRATLKLENLALCHQIGVLQRSAAKRPKLTPWDRLLWIGLSMSSAIIAYARSPEKLLQPLSERRCQNSSM
jgi:hypothetical protein